MGSGPPPPLSSVSFGLVESSLPCVSACSISWCANPPAYAHMHMHMLLMHARSLGLTAPRYNVLGCAGRALLAAQ